MTTSTDLPGPRALEACGLIDVDDFYLLELDLPEWLQLRAQLKP